MEASLNVGELTARYSLFIVLLKEREVSIGLEKSKSNATIVEYVRRQFGVDSRYWFTISCCQRQLAPFRKVTFRSLTS